MAVEQAFKFEDLNRILVDRVGLAEENVSDDPDMGLDSLAFVEIQLAMQQDYGFTIPDEDADEITTVGQAIDYTNRRIAEGD